MTSRSPLRRLAGVGSRFLVVGAISTIIEIAVFNLLAYGFGVDLVASKVIASLVALVNAYVGNREWTFRHRERRGRVSEIALFLAVNAVCTVLGAVLVWAGVEGARWVLGSEPGPLIVNIVNAGSIGIVVVFRFVLYHGLVFRVPVQAAPPADDA